MKGVWILLPVIAIALFFPVERSWSQIILMPGGEFLFYESTRDGISQIYRMDRVKTRALNPWPPQTTLRVTETRVSRRLNYPYRYPATYWKWVANQGVRRAEITIAYTSQRGSSWNIFTNNDQGDSESTPRATGVEEKRNLRWSPDGRWISYIQKSTQGDRIYRVSASGAVQSNAISGTERSIAGHGWLDDNRIIYAKQKEQSLIPGTTFVTYQFVVRRADGGAAGTEIYPISIADFMCPVCPCKLIDMKISHNRQHVALAWEFKIPVIEVIEEKIEVLSVAPGLFLLPVKTVDLDDPAFNNKTSDIGSIGWSGSDNLLYVAARERQSQNTAEDDRMEIYAYKLNLHDPNLAVTQENYTNNSAYDSYPDGEINLQLYRVRPGPLNP